MDLDQALDELYGAEREDFVAERKRLAKELKAEDRTDDAAHVTKVRKPTVAAWAMNRLARDHRRDVDLLLDSGHRLRTAQAGVLRGDARETFEQAQRTERDTIGRLVHAADELLGERGGASSSVLEQIAASLHAAAVSEGGRELLAAGRFTQPLTLEGFDALAGLAPPPSKRRAKKKPSRALTERFDEWRSMFGVPGVSWATIVDDEIAEAGTLGVRDATSSDPVTAATRFQACSISKPIAAFAMLRLVDRGVLDLDADINESLTSWRLPRNSEWQPIVTLRHLVSHSAGLTTSGFPGYKRTEKLPTTVEILSGVHPANTFGVRVDTIPGAQFRYSGGGTLALQQLLEDATRTPFADLMQELVLAPLGMRDSDYTQPPAESVHDVLASGHDELGSPVEGGWHVYPEQATAGLWTTPTDLCRYALAVRAAFVGAPDALLSQPLAQEMLTPQVSASDRIGGLSALGLGPFLSGEPNARFGHSGGNEGFRCHLLAYRDVGLGAAVMTNSDAGGWFLQHAFADLAESSGWPGYHEEIVEYAWPDPATLDACTGTYRLRDGFDLTVAPGHHSLEVRFAGQPPMSFGFVARTDAGALEFASNVTATALRLESESDAGKAITFIQNGHEIVCPRL